MSYRYTPTRKDKRNELKREYVLEWMDSFSSQLDDRGIDPGETVHLNLTWSGQLEGDGTGVPERRFPKYDPAIFEEAIVDFIRWLREEGWKASISKRYTWFPPPSIDVWVTRPNEED